METSEHSLTGDTIPCPKCTRQIVPQLHHYGGSKFMYARTQHLCPFCGVCLHETGGGFRKEVKLVVLVLAGAFGVLFLLAILLNNLPLHWLRWPPR